VEDIHMKTRVLLTFVILASAVAKADFSVTLGTVFSGAIPGETNPLTATFTDLGAGTALTCGVGVASCVQLTMKANGLATGEFVSEWDFNTTATSLTIAGPGTKTGSFNNPSVGGLSSNNYKADGDGYYDFSFGYDTSSGTSNRFDGTFEKP